MGQQRVVKHEVPPSLAGQVEGLGARDAGSKTRSTLWPAHSCKGIRTSSIISLRVYILSCLPTSEGTRANLMM